MVLGRFAGFEGFLSAAVLRVAAKHPPPEAGYTEGRDQKRDGQGEPGGNPLAGEKVHGSIITDP